MLLFLLLDALTGVSTARDSSGRGEAPTMRIRLPIVYLLLALLGLSIGSQLEESRKPPSFAKVERYVVSQDKAYFAVDISEKSGHRFRVFRNKDGKPVGRELLKGAAASKGMHFSGDGSTIVIDWGLETKVYKVKNGKLLGTFKTDEMHYNVCLSHDGSRLAMMGPKRGKIHFLIYDVKTGEQLQKVEKDRPGVGWGPVLDKKGEHIAYSSNDTVTIEPVGEGTPLTFRPKGPQINELKSLAGGKLLAVSSWGAGKAQVQFYDFRKGKAVGATLPHPQDAYLTDSTVKGDRVITSYSTGSSVEVTVWDRKKGKRLSRHQGFGAKFSADGKHLGVSEFKEGHLYSPTIYDLKTKEEIYRLPAGDRLLLGFHHRGRKLGLWTGKWTGMEWGDVNYRQVKLDN